METVMTIEKDFGNSPVDVGAQKVGYDVESRTSDNELRFIEVKGRQAGQGTVTVTHNEMLVAANQPERTLLAVVEIDGPRRHVTYYQNWVQQPPGFADVNHTIELDKLRRVATVAFEKEIHI